MKSYTIGRSDEADIVIPSKHVSRLHARLTEYAEHSYVVEDLASTSGTFILKNGQWSKVARAKVGIADSIRLGNLERSVESLIAAKRKLERGSDPKLVTPTPIAAEAAGAQERRGSEVFISYAREDIERVRPLVAFFERQGLSVFWDRKIDPGQQWSNEIERALSAARVVVVVWSKTSVRSEWVKAEAMASRERSALLPIKIDDVSIPLPFSLTETVDLSGTKDLREQSETLQRLRRAITRMVDRADVPRKSPNESARAPGLFHAAPSYSGFDFARTFFDLNGRLSRMHLLLATLALMPVGMLIQLLVASLLTNAWFYRSKLELQIAIQSLTLTIMLYPMVCVYVKRLHDVNRSGYWAILIVVLACANLSGSMNFMARSQLRQPSDSDAIEFLVIMQVLSMPMYALMLWPGNRIANRFGPPPLR